METFYCLFVNIVVSLFVGTVVLPLPLTFRGFAFVRDFILVFVNFVCAAGYN